MQQLGGEAHKPKPLTVMDIQGNEDSSNRQQTNRVDGRDDVDRVLHDLFPTVGSHLEGTSKDATKS